MTLKQLRELKDSWQERLEIPEWTIKLHWAIPSRHKGLSGFCDYQTEYRCANIWIARDEPSKEFFLVHELLHIVLEGHKEEQTPYDVHMERAINRISGALVSPGLAQG